MNPKFDPPPPERPTVEVGPSKSYNAFFAMLDMLVDQAKQLGRPLEMESVFQAYAETTHGGKYSLIDQVVVMNHIGRTWTNELETEEEEETNDES